MERKEIFPWGTFDIDPETGLPALPEGQFWRVSERSTGFYEVTRCRNDVVTATNFWGKTETKSVVVKLAEGLIRPEEFTESMVLHTAAYVFRNFAPRPTAEELEKIKRRSQKLLGDYPPKKLEN